MSTHSGGVRIAIAGDVALGGEYVEQARPRGASLTYPFAPLRDLLTDVELLVVNLEGPIGTDGPPRAGRSALLYNDPAVLHWLSSFPCCVCTLANNHAMDYGAQALVRTQQFLQEYGIHCVGAGRDIHEARRSLQLEVNGVRLGFLAYTTEEPHVGSVIARESEAGSNGLPQIDVARKEVEALSSTVDFVVVLLHWGYEYYKYPTPMQVHFARELVHAGATLVAAHHPHVEQGWETHGSALICHSLGNLIVPEMRATSGRVQFRKPVSKQFAILRADIGPKQILRSHLHGGRCDRWYNLIPYGGDAADRFATELAQISQPLSRSDYDGFYEAYRHRRSRQLAREEIYDAFRKLRTMDPATFLSTAGMADVKRNFRRLKNLLRGGFQ